MVLLENFLIFLSPILYSCSLTSYNYLNLKLFEDGFRNWNKEFNGPKFRGSYTQRIYQYTERDYFDRELCTYMLISLGSSCTFDVQFSWNKSSNNIQSGLCVRMLIVNVNKGMLMSIKVFYWTRLNYIPDDYL